MPPPRDALIDLVHSTRALMIVSLERPALLTPYGDLLRSAWPRVEEHFGLILSELQSGAFRELSERVLARHGLDGPELEAKWRVFHSESARFFAGLDRLDSRRTRNRLFGNPAPYVPLNTDYAETEEKRGVIERLRRRGRKIVQSPLWKALAVVDEALGSVGDAFPPVAIAASALGEFKGVMEAVAAPE